MRSKLADRIKIMTFIYVAMLFFAILVCLYFIVFSIAMPDYFSIAIVVPIVAIRVAIEWLKIKEQKTHIEELNNRIGETATRPDMKKP